MKLKILQLFYFVIVAGVLLCCSACRTCGTGASHPQQQTQMEKQSVCMGEKMLAAIQKDDYDAFTAAYDSRDKQLSPEEFQGSCSNFKKQFGEIISFRYLTELKTPLVDNNLWIVTFERYGGEGKEKKRITQELLFRLVTGEIDGMTRVIGLGFL